MGKKCADDVAISIHSIITVIQIQHISFCFSKFSRKLSACAVHEYQALSSILGPPLVICVVGSKTLKRWIVENAKVAYSPQFLLSGSK